MSPVLRKVVKKLGRFPTQRDLQNNNLSSIGTAITHHGGANAVRKRLGIEAERKDKGYYSKKNNVHKEVQAMIRQHPEFEGDLPSTVWMNKNGYSSLLGGIRKCYGSYGSFRKKEGLEGIQVATGKWKDLEFAVQQAIDLMHKHKFGNLPGSFTLDKLGYASLVVAVQKYHGGMPRFRQELHTRLGIQGEETELSSLLEKYAGVAE